MRGRRASYLVVLILLAALSLGVHEVSASTLDLLGVGWNKASVTVLIKAGKGVTAQAIDDVKTAIDDWNAALNPLPSGESGPDLLLVNGVNTADIVIQMKVGGGTVLGQTLPKTISPFSCVLKSVTIQLSGKAFGTAFSSAGTQNVARHELGHALGLGHNIDDPNDLMYGSAESAEIFGNTNVPISDCDKKGLDAVYPLPNFCAILDSVSCP